MLIVLAFTDLDKHGMEDSFKSNDEDNNGGGDKKPPRKSVMQ